MQGTLFYEGAPICKFTAINVVTYQVSISLCSDRWADLIFFLQKNFATFENINTIIYFVDLALQNVAEKKFREERANAKASYGN